MRLRRLALPVAVIALLFAAVLNPPMADASSKFTSANVVGGIKIDPADPTVGYLRATYRCFGTGALWVSVKQTADRTASPALTEEGSSAISAAWSDSHRNPVTCDGIKHTQTFSVDQIEPYYSETGPLGPKSEYFGPLERGRAYIQFCLFDDSHVDEPVTDTKFAHVH